MNNIMLMTDSYKVSHWKQYPPKTEKIYSYFESRGGLYEKGIFFGLQYIIKKYLLKSVVSIEALQEAAELLHAHFGKSTIFNYAGWEYIMNNHNGRLPIEIKAVPEGTIVPVKNVLFTVENTDPACFWLPSYLETMLEQIWYPCTIATQSHYMRKTIEKYLAKTGNDAADFKLHDFGYRGSSSQESAGIGAASHLLSFQGTDTLAGILLLQKYYHAAMPGYSIPAAEHSTITSWGKDHELDAYKNMLDQYPTGLVAVVSDSYNIFEACRELWGKKLRDQIISRNGTLIVRPDSGNPTTVIAQVLDILGKAFGCTINEKGYKVLPPYIRIIQGDGITEESLSDILAFITTLKWSVDNIAFGSGGGLLQKANRDTMRFAYKCSNVTIDGENREVSKAPLTDPTKFSKKGRLSLVKEGKTYKTVSGPVSGELTGELVSVFRNGELLVDHALEDIRKRTHEG